MFRVKICVSRRQGAFVNYGLGEFSLLLVPLNLNWLVELVLILSFICK